MTIKTVMRRNGKKVDIWAKAKTRNQKKRCIAPKLVQHAQLIQTIIRVFANRVLWLSGLVTILNGVNARETWVLHAENPTTLIDEKGRRDGKGC